MPKLVFRPSLSGCSDSTYLVDDNGEAVPGSVQYMPWANPNPHISTPDGSLIERFYPPLPGPPSWVYHGDKNTKTDSDADANITWTIPDSSSNADIPYTPPHAGTSSADGNAVVSPPTLSGLPDGSSVTPTDFESMLADWIPSSIGSFDEPVNDEDVNDEDITDEGVHVDADTNDDFPSTTPGYSWAFNYPLSWTLALGPLEPALMPPRSPTPPTPSELPQPVDMAGAVQEMTLETK
ncbi:hypothetical protein FB45DRAFT_1031850 [Roridomyces roridus]|uniref:Uncharacterized protein n=1 Tax=Roridomyces roridus TaxID=1738132 RepID=A0AAD7BIN6_9AGAR|nr:hypothetical protein FB45DRAFT_1031850 [Roridomyces roridus]